MKTTMQELIEHIQINATKFSLMNTYNILKEIEPYLEKEKEQMIDFGYKCRNKCKKESKLLPQDIFNTTYNQKQ